MPQQGATEGDDASLRQLHLRNEANDWSRPLANTFTAAQLDRQDAQNTLVPHVEITNGCFSKFASETVSGPRR